MSGEHAVNPLRITFVPKKDFVIAFLERFLFHMILRDLEEAVNPVLFQMMVPLRVNRLFMTGAIMRSLFIWN